ncbi:hypothetical protein [Streptomyces sp. NPDC094032]|uniref:hypothetical protein n=1 Tax=Streptomyces sp. NPDC094032 TaxID=3155308 RepID=UPI00331B3C81
MTRDLRSPLPLSTSPEYYLRLARKGAAARGQLLVERYRPSDVRLEEYLRLLYGAVIFNTPALDLEPHVLSLVVRTEDQRALDNVDRLFNLLDRAALAFASLDGPTHTERLITYANHVEHTGALRSHPLHQFADMQVSNALRSHRISSDVMRAVGFPRAAAVDLLTAVVRHAEALPPAPPALNREAIYRGPDGSHYVIDSYTSRGLLVLLRPVSQDPDTREWKQPRDRSTVEVPEDTVRQYTVVPREPLADPRITRLGTLVRDLLAAYETAAGHPLGSAKEIRAALAAVEAIPGETRARQYSAWSAGNRNGYSRGRRRR